MDKFDRTSKLSKVYERVQRWIQLHKGQKSPSEMNIANAALREIEEITLKVENDENYPLSKHCMKRLNYLWKCYKV